MHTADRQTHIIKHTKMTAAILYVVYIWNLEHTACPHVHVHVLTHVMSSQHVQCTNVLCFRDTCIYILTENYGVAPYHG